MVQHLVKAVLHFSPKTFYARAIFIVWAVISKIVIHSQTIHNNAVKAIIKIHSFSPTTDCMESCGVKTVTEVWCSNSKTEQKSKNNSRAFFCPTFFVPENR